jgi:hypothetical protein
MMILTLLAAMAAFGPLHADVPVNGENLQYMINWPSGLSLGEGKIKATRDGEQWNFELQFDAAIPGFAVADRFLSRTTPNLCSLEFQKELVHGKRKSKEKITFDQEQKIATRETVGGGKSTLSIPACAKDALAFLFHLRRELSQGRLPPAQDVYYGAAYRIKVEFGGTQKVRVGEAEEAADQILASVKGPGSEFTLEFYISKDQARVPLLVKLPLSLGTISVELVR